MHVCYNDLQYEYYSGNRCIRGVRLHQVRATLGESESSSSERRCYRPDLRSLAIKFWRVASRQYLNLAIET